MERGQERQWDRLQLLVDQIDRSGLKSLTHEELMEFGRLYRRASSDLSYAQTHGLDPNVRQYLNQLIGRAYGHVYQSKSRRFSFAKFIKFFRADFPATVRKEWPFIATATAVFLLASLVAFWATLYDPIYAEALLPRGMLEMMDRVLERHEVGGDWLPGVTRPLASSQIMTNNITVAFLAFSSGILYGLGTIYVLLVNGSMIGALAAVASEADLATLSNLWGFIAPHGVIEIPAILLAAGAGLILGHALINPGEYDRKTALKLAGRRAIRIVLGVVAILFVAGVIEAFFSPTQTPDEIKFTFAAVLFFLFVTYLFKMPIPDESN